MLTRLRDGDAIKNHVTLIEQGLHEIIFLSREVRKVHILSRDRKQFTLDVEFDI